RPSTLRFTADVTCPTYHHANTFFKQRCGTCSIYPRITSFLGSPEHVDIHTPFICQKRACFGGRCTTRPFRSSRPSSGSLSNLVRLSCPWGLADPILASGS